MTINNACAAILTVNDKIFADVYLLPLAIRPLKDDLKPGVSKSKLNMNPGSRCISKNNPGLNPNTRLAKLTSHRPKPLPNVCLPVKSD